MGLSKCRQLDLKDSMQSRSTLHLTQSPLYETLAAWLSSAALFLDFAAVPANFPAGPSATDINFLDAIRDIQNMHVMLTSLSTDFVLKAKMSYAAE